MPIADRITVGNPASFSSIESQITNGPPLSSTNAVAYNGKLWMVGGVSTVQDVTIKTYTDVVSTQFQNVLYYFKQAKQYQLSIAEDARAHFNFPDADYIQTNIDFINTEYQTNYDAYIAASADAQLQYELHKANGDETSDFTYQTTHTIAVSEDGYTWTRIDQNPFALVSYQINAPQTLEHVSRVNGLAWNGSLWLAIGDGGGTANQTTVFNTAADPDNPLISAPNYNATNQLATSPDGVTWTVRGRPGRMFSGLAGAPYGGGQPYGVAASSSLFMVVCGNLSGIVNRSLNGSDIYDPYYDDVCTICKSTDGINWSKVGNSGDFITEEAKWEGYSAVGGLFQGYSVAYNGAYWVAVGAGLPDLGGSYSSPLTGTLRSCIVVSSDDGATWTQGLDNYVGPDPNNASLKNYYNVFSVAWNGSYWLAVGQISDYAHYIPSNFGQTGGKYYWAGDNQGVIITSTDSLDWTVTTGFPVFTTVAWDGNYWIASGQIGLDYNSPGTPVIGVTKRSRDGVNWELLSLSGNAIATKIPLPILGGTVNTVSSLIVGFGSPMSILRSFDDETWYPQLTDGYGNNFSGSIQKEFRQVLWTGSSWVVVGKPQYGRNGQTILTSPDALSWTYPSNDLEYGRGIAWNGTMAVAVGSGATTQIATSTDLTTWTNRTQDNNIIECNCVAWNGSMWVIGGNGGLNFSTDGTTWIRAAKCPLNIVNGLAWNGYTWLAVGTGSLCTIAISTDGMHWYPVKSDPFSVECSQVAWNGNLWVAVGSSNNSIATSFDGYNWVGQGTSIFGIDGTSISWTGTLWIATGSGRVRIASSPDGTTWTPFDIQLIHGNSYANKTITLPYTVYTPSDETVGLVDAVVTIISDLTTADAIAEAEALAIFQNEVATAAATAAALAARNATKANADTFRTRLLYWKSVITQQYSPLIDKSIVDLSEISTTEFLDVKGVYNTVNANVDIMESYYSVIYDDTNTQDSINATLSLLIDLVTHIESTINDSFYYDLAYLYTQLTNGTYDSRDPSNMVYIITNWGFPEITKNVVLTAYNNGITAYNSAKSTALDIFNTIETPIPTIVYTEPSSSNAPDFSGAYATLETAANTVIVMNEIFNFALPYKTQADAYYNQAKSDVIGWANIIEETPDTAAVDAAFAPYYKQYFYSPSYEPEDDPPTSPPTIYVLDVSKQVTVYTYDNSDLTGRTLNMLDIGVRYFKTTQSEFSHPGAHPSILATLYTQMKSLFDEVNAKKQAALAYAINLRNTTIKDKLADFLDVTSTKYTSLLTIDDLINSILSVSVYANSPYESSTRLALIAKAGSLLYPTMFPLLLAVHKADIDAEADGCLPPLRGWGSSSNDVPLNELGTQGNNGWQYYNKTYYTRNALSAFIGTNTSPASTAVYNASSTDPSTFLGNYYTLYNKALSWIDFLEFTNGATHTTMTAAYEAFKTTITEFEANELFNTATADSYVADDVAAIDSQYVPAATSYIKTLAASVRKNIPSDNELTEFGYLYTGGTVTSISLTNYGKSYTIPPTVNIIGGSGTGAHAIVPSINREISEITLTSAGSGYIYAPTVNITTIETNGIGATAEATLSNVGGVYTIGILASGSGYYQSDVEVTFTDNGITDAVGYAVIRDGRLINIDLARFGSGYTSTPTVNIIGGNGTGATAVATISDQQITDIRITNPGSGYTSKPIITFTIGSRTSATATCLVRGSLSNIQVTNGGSGYSSAPSVIITGGNGTGATAVANVAIPSGGSTFSDNVARINTDFTSLKSIATTDMGSYTHLQLKNAVTTAKGLVTDINTVQGTSKYKEIMAGIPIYKTVRANAYTYKNLLQKRVERWINMKKNALTQSAGFKIGQLNGDEGDGKDSIMSIPPSNSIYWAPRKFTLFGNIDSGKIEECYYNVGTTSIMALPAFNNTGAAGVYRGRAVYYSNVTYSSSDPPTTGRINYSSSGFSEDGYLFLSNSPGSGDIQYQESVRSYLLQLIVNPTPIVGYLRIYSTTSTLNYATLKVESGVNTVGGVKLTCTAIETVGALNTGNPIYVAFSTDIGIFDSINYSPEFTLYSPTDRYRKDCRVKDENGVVYQCIKDNTNPIISGINNQPPPLYPDKWRRRVYPYVVYHGQSIEADPANITMLTLERTSTFNIALSYSQGDYVNTLNESGNVVYYCCINDIDTTGYIIGINPSNSNYWTPRTYQTGKVKGNYVELNPANYPAFDALSVSPYSKSTVYSNQDYISYKKAVYRLTISVGTTQTGLDPSPENGWALVPTMVPAYSDIQIYEREDYVSYNDAVYCLIVGVGITKQGLTPGSSPWMLVTNPIAVVGTTQQIIQITTETCPPLQASNFSQYQDTYDRPKTIVTGGAVYTSEFVYETLYKQYINNNFVSYNGGVYECLFSTGSLIGVPLSHDYFWKKVTYPMAFYNDVLTEVFPGKIPPYEYTPDYTAANGRPLSTSFEFLPYSDVVVYKKGDLVQYEKTLSYADLVTAMTETYPEIDISSYTTAEQLLAFIKTSFPAYYNGIVTSGFYECVDDSISVVPIVNIPPTNETYWLQLDYQLIEHTLAGIIPADPSILADPTNNQSGSLFKLLNENDYHEYDNNWIYRVGDLVSYNGTVYSCTNCLPPDLPPVIRNIPPESNRIVWQDLNSIATTYDEEVINRLYVANNITTWSPFTNPISGTATISDGSVTNIAIVNGGYENTSGTLVTVDNDLGTRAVAYLGYIKNTVRYVTNKRTTCQIFTDDVYGLTVGQYVRFLITSGGNTTIYKDGEQELFLVTEVSPESFKVTAGGDLLSDITEDAIDWISRYGSIENIEVTCSGRGYTNSPIVVITGDGTDAAATAIISDGCVVRIDITNPGSGYTSDPIITFKICETTATLNPPTIVDGVVTNVTVASGGTGYTSAPIIAGNNLQTVNGRQYLKDSFVSWCGDIYKCEMDITYQPSYTLNTPADITALQNSIPSLNPLHWTLITDYTIFTTPIPAKYNASTAYSEGSIVTKRIPTDPTTAQAIRTLSLFNVVDYTLTVYKAINVSSEMTYGAMVGISPLESTGYWKDISSGGSDYDSYVAPLYAANNITKWWPFNAASYTKGSIVTWDGDFYMCETPVTYQSSYNLYIPEHVIALKNSIPPNNPTVWSLITDYTIFATTIPNKYDPKVAYLETDEVTIRTVLDPSTAEAISASGFFGVDVYHTLTFYECVSTDPSYPVEYTYDDFSAIDPSGTDSQGNTTYNYGLTPGTDQSYDQPRYVPKDMDPFGLPNFAHIIRRNVAMYIELPYKYAKTHVEAARRGDFGTFTTLIAGATRLKYNFAALSVKPENAGTEFNTFLTDINTAIDTFDSSELSIEDIDYTVKRAYAPIVSFLRTWRDDMNHFVNQVNIIKTQYFNLPSVQAAIYKNPYKYLNPVALATNNTTPGAVKIMFRDLGIGDIDEITYNLDVLHNHILSTEAERTYYNKNVVIITNYINSINEHINAAKDLIGFSVLSLAVTSNTKAGVRINCIVPNVDNVLPIYIDTPITDFNGLDNYTEQRNFNENVVGDRNILGTCTYAELQSLVAYNKEGDTYYIKNYVDGDINSLSPEEQEIYYKTDQHLFVFKQYASRNAAGYDQDDWVDLGYFDDPLVNSTITGYINAMVLESVKPPNYTLPTSKESATALAITYESQNPNMRGLTMFANGVVGTVAAGFQNIWDPMAILGLVNLISGQTLLEGGGLTFPNFNDRAESITLLNQLVAIEIGKKLSVKRAIVSFGITSGTTTTFQLGLSGMVKNACYNIGLFNSGGAQQEGLSVTYADRAEFTILSIANQNINPGYISFTNGTTASGTITISIYDRNLTDVSSFSSMLYSSPATIKGYIVIYSVSTPSIFSVFSITGGSSTGSGTISAASLTCTFIRSSGTGSLGENPNNVGVVFSKTLPSETAIYGSTLLTNDGKDLKLVIPAGTGTASIYGAKITTGVVKHGRYTLKYKLTTDNQYYDFTPAVLYNANATNMSGWSTAQSEYIVPSATTTAEGSDIHSLSDLDAGITTIGKLLLLNSMYRENLEQTLETIGPSFKRGERSFMVDLPRPVKPLNALNIPTNNVVIPPKPQLKLEESIQGLIDDLRKQERKLKRLRVQVRSEAAALQGLPVKIKAIRVPIPPITYDITRTTVAPSSNPPRATTYSALDEREISAIKVKYGNGAKANAFIEDIKRRASLLRAPKSTSSGALGDIGEFIETKVPNNLEQIEKAIAENAELERRAIEANRDAVRLKSNKIVTKFVKAEQSIDVLNDLDSAIDRSILEENAIQIRNSQKTAEFAQAELEYNKAVDASNKADIDIAQKRAAYKEQLAKYKRLKTLNATQTERVIQKALTKAKQLAFAAAIKYKITKSGRLKVTYNTLEIRMSQHPVVKESLRGKFFGYFKAAFEYTFEDLFNTAKRLGRQGNTARSFVQNAVRANITQADVNRANGRLKNLRAIKTMETRAAILAKTGSNSLAKATSKALSKAATATGRAIMRAPILGVAGIGMEIYGAIMTAIANGAYESAPTILGS